MTIVEEVVEILDGMEYGEDIAPMDRKYAKENGAVIVFGVSDDLIEFRGAIYDEDDAYGGGTVYFNRSGILQSECEIDGCPYFEKIKVDASEITTIWDSEGYSWTYETDIPHETFDIMDEGEKYCRGIVFLLTDVAEVQ